MIERASAHDEPPRRPHAVRGLIVRLRGWLGTHRSHVEAASPIAPDVLPVIERIGAISGFSSDRHLADAGRAQRNRWSAAGETVVALPISRRQQLNQLANRLRARFVVGDSCPDDPLLLAMAPAPLQRLCIDSSAHIEALDDPVPYRVVLGHEFDTRVILETTSFDTAQEFVLQYLLLTRDQLGSAEVGA